MNIKWVGSKHKEKGRRGFHPEAVVIHVMDGSLIGTDAWFNDVSSQVSAHYGVGFGGEIHQYVGEMDTAFHAGKRWKSSWAGIKTNPNPNFYTIGIEHEGREDTIWPEPMYRASANLVAEMCSRWGIPIDRDHVIGHCEIRSSKPCPGTADLDHLVQLARACAIDPILFNFIPRAGSIHTVSDLNLRRGAPTTVADVVRVIPADTVIQFVGWTSNGLSVNGNAHWYRDSDGNYFWAGATDRRVPGL